MIGFEYYNPAKIIFGEESEKKLKGLLKQYHVTSLLLVYSGDFIKSLGIYPVIEEAAKELGIHLIENGNVVKVGALMTGEREVYKATAPAANTPITEIALIADPEVMYDERKKALYEFINEAGDIVRGYRLHTGDIFSVTAEALATSLSAIEVGNVVELQAGTKLKVTSSLTANSTQVGTIIDINVVGPYTYYAIQVK